MDVRLDEVVLRALEKKPELRYQQASVLKTQVETIAQTPEQSSSAKPENHGPRWLVGTLPTTPLSKAFGWIYIIFFAGYFLLLVNDHFTGSVNGMVWRCFGYGFIGFAVVGGVELLFRIGRARKAKTPEMSRAIKALLKPMLIGGAIALLLGVYVGVLHTYQSRRLKSDYLGQSWFPQGDSIAITSVERSTNRMVVKGHYHLVSKDQATLALYITTSTDMRVPEDSKNRMQISKGRGDFELTHSHLVPGLPHVSMYADGGSFAALYFGNEAEALEESKAAWISKPDQSVNGVENKQVQAKVPATPQTAEPVDLQAARAKLTELRVDYSEQHLVVQKALARVRELERMTLEEPKASAELREAKAHLTELRVEYSEQHSVIQEALARVKELEGTSREELNSTITDIKTNSGAANAAIQNWLSLMDDGQYAESWRQASEGFHALVTQDDWVNKLESARKLLGKLLSRKVEKAEPNGQYFVAKFDSSFEKLKAATETVTFVLDANGQWRAGGYLITPRSQTNSVAVEPAQAWLQEIDHSNYAQSWTNAAALFQQAITSEQWVQSLQTARKPLGPLISRKVMSAREMSSLPGVPDGRYIVMQFETAFANKQSAAETVTFVQEKDGQWRAAGYYIK